jgi:diguanylate cyclase (GGDEF)-like protein/PAS domain S-box-containing protein
MATSLRLLTSRSVVVVLTLIAIAAVWTAAFREVQISREREFQEARKETENYARAFEEHIARTIESVDAVVLTVMRELGRAGMPAVRRDLVRLHKIHRDIVAVISVIDVRGDLIANSPPAPVVNLADRPHFRAHVERDSGKPFLGQPLLGRVSQKWSMHVSRRVNNAAGSFAGVVVASIDLDYLKRFYQSVSLGKDGVIQLIGNDGIVRVRSSDEGISAGQDASSMKLFQDLRDGSRLGTYSESSPFDQVRRIVSYRVVEGHPLVVTVNISEKVLLERMQPIARHYYLGAGGMTLLLAVMLALTDLMVNRQRRMSRELEQSEQRLSLAQEGSEQALFDWNIVTGEVFLSERWSEMIGDDRKPVHTTIDKLARLVHPDDIEGQRTSIIEALKGDAPYRKEHRVRTRTGEWIWIQSHGKVTARDARGRALRLVGYNDDITSRKIAQLALAESEERFRATFENAPVGIMHTTIEDNRILQVNPKLCEMLGYTRDELLGLVTDEILHPDYRGTDRSKYRESMLNGDLDSFSSERVFARKDGSSLWVDRTVSLSRDASGQPLYFIRMVEDITERKRAEAEVGRERALLRAIIDTVPDNIYVKDAEGRFSLANKAWLKERNLSDETLVGKTVFDIFPAELAERVAAQDGEIVRTGVPMLDFEQRVVVKTPEGGRSQPRWLSVTKVPMVDASAKIIGTVGTSHDITERKRSAQRREMEHAIASVLADATTVKEALPKVIRAICEGLDWDCGFHWSWDKSSELLRCQEHWYRPADAMDDFVQASLGMVNEAPVAVSATPSGGLVRRVWVGATPVWLPDVASMPDFRRAPTAMRADLHGAFAFPIMIEGRPWGVMEFFSHEIREPDEALLQIVRAIGSQIGQFIRRKEAEQALLESEEQFRQLAGNIPQVFWICDARQHSVVYISSAYREITGLDPEKLKVRAHGWLDAVHPDDRQQLVAARKEAASGGYDQTFRIVKPDGSIRWIRDRAFPVYDASGSVYRIAGIGEDITEKKAAEERLSQLAHFDILTGLPNRALFLDRMRQAMTLARRHDRATGVMFLDLDRFKVTNDTLGHSAGDQLLKQVGERLSGCIREGDTVGRFGGDEFGIVLADMRSPDDARLVAQKILDAIQSPFELEGHEVFVTASVGISLYPGDSDDQTELMKNADAAMYRAKESGRNRYEFYSKEMNARSLQRLNLEGNLRRALERGEYLLHYQPKASLATREITGFEALLRWTAGGEKLVSPADFVPLLEDTGLIVPVGEWVIEAACRQLVTWREAGVQPVPIAINLSARQFRDKNLAATIERILRAHDVDPRLIEIELTESSLMVNTDEAVRTLSYLKSLGVRLSIDDFGTGYSSLAYLRRFPLDTLKIDRSFVNDVTTHADVANITRAVIGMSHNLGLKVVAEGVETEAQLAFLEAAGCGEMQGYFFSRPMPAADSLQWLREHRRLPSPVIVLPEGKPRKQRR